MEILKSNVAVGIGAAVLAMMAAPVVLPVIATAGRPLAKALIKSGMMFCEKSREAVASAGEVMEDLIAEVRAEEINRHASSATSVEEAVSSVSSAGDVRPQGGNGSEQRFGAHETAARVDPRPDDGMMM